MRFAPEFKPEGLRRGRLYRVLSGLGLSFGVGVGAVLAFALYFASLFVVATPEQLYHRTWVAAQWLIYDPSAMKDWAAWEHKFDGQIKTNEDAVRFSNEMLKSLNDRYTRLSGPEEVKAQKEQMEGNFTGIGVVFDIQFKGDGEPVLDSKGQPLPAVNGSGNPVLREVMENSPAAAGGLQAGDAIVSIDGVATAGKSLDEIVKLVRNKAGTQLVVEFERAGVKQPPVTITRGVIHVPTVTTKILPGDIGYIRLKGFDTYSAADEMETALRQLSGAKSIILDLRGNPGGLVGNAIDISSMFVEEGTIVSIRSRTPSSPGSPSWHTETYKVTKSGMVHVSGEDGIAPEVKKGKRRDYLLAGRPLVILVDGHSASASEMTTGALQDNGVAVVIGEKTFGKGIGQMTIPMPNGTMLTITSLRYFTPSGKWLGDGGNSVSNGITPDIEVKPGKKNFKLGGDDDNQLKAAIDHLRSR